MSRIDYKMRGRVRAAVQKYPLKTHKQIAVMLGYKENTVRHAAHMMYKLKQLKPRGKGPNKRAAIEAMQRQIRIRDAVNSAPKGTLYRNIAKSLGVPYGPFRNDLGFLRASGQIEYRY